MKNFTKNYDINAIGLFWSDWIFLNHEYQVKLVRVSNDIKESQRAVNGSF